MSRRRKPPRLIMIAEDSLESRKRKRFLCVARRAFCSSSQQQKKQQKPGQQSQQQTKPTTTTRPLLSAPARLSTVVERAREAALGNCFGRSERRRRLRGEGAGCAAKRANNSRSALEAKGEGSANCSPACSSLPSPSSSSIRSTARSGLRKPHTNTHGGGGRRLTAGRLRSLASCCRAQAQASALL